MTFIDRFGSVAADYAAFRPSYPAAMFEWLTAQVPSTRLAWDCATGSGQAAWALAKYFDRVIATDGSADQIANAISDPRIQYRVAPAENSEIEGGTVDLVTVAQALHWLEIDRFFLECNRVLRPGGVLAVWTYGPPQIERESVDIIVRQYYHEIVGPYWPPERALVDSAYLSVKFPYPEIEAPHFKMFASWTLAELLGYLGTWSSTTAYRNALGTDPRELIALSLAQAWGKAMETREVTWPLTVRAGKKGQIEHGSSALVQ